MADENSTKLTKFPNAEEANREAPAVTGLPSAFDLFKPSVKVLQNNLMGFLILLGIPAVLILIGQGSSLWQPANSNQGLFPVADGPLGAVLLIGWVVTILTTPGLVLMELKGVRKEAIGWQAAFSQGLSYVARILGLGLLTALILGASLIAFIVPFFFVLPRVVLASYYLIDRNLGVIEALKASWNDYKAYKGTWGVIGVMILLSLASLVPVIGWLVAAVLSFLYSVAPAIRYEQIKRMAAGQIPRTPIENDVQATA